MFIQFIYANDLRPLFVLVVQFFQCLGLWNSGGKKITHPNPPIAVSYGTWWWISSISTKWASLLPTKTSCFFPENSSHLGEPQHFLLRSTARVEFPHLRPAAKRLWKSSLVKRFPSDFSQYHKWDPYRAIFSPKKCRKRFFFNLAFWFFFLFHLFRWSEGDNLEFYQNDRYLWI